jgi:carboxyl-terminal processing protease
MFRLGWAVSVSCVVFAFGLAGVGVALSESPDRDGSGLLAPLKSAPPQYQFESLPLLKETLSYIEENYVEPGRIDWEAMYVAALDRVERQVPSVLFERQDQTISLSAGAFHTVLEVPKIESRAALHEELRRAAAILHDNVPRSDVPDLPGSPDPYAPLEYAMVNGILATLDPHSLLLPPENSREMDVENQGEFGGLGISIGEDDGDLLIQYPNPGSPAELAGVQAGDRVVRIDGELMVNLGLDAAVERLRGPVDEPVVLTVERAGSKELLDLTVIRKIIKYNEVRGTLLDGAVGYVVIESFHGLVESGLKERLAQLQREAGGKLKGLILDLRGNPGGLLSQAVAVSDMFLSGGDIVSTTDGRGRSKDAMEAKIEPTDLTMPLVVLVNGNSASASEIVAGALRNNDRAVIIGERSFGKGSVQNLYDLVDGSKLKLTTQHYLTPGERSIQGVGIPADIALLPVHVEAREPGPGDEYVAAHDRDHMRREADLDHALVMDSRPDTSAWSFQYLAPPTKQPPPTAELQTDTFEIQFARDVLLAANSSRRAEILARVGPTVERYRQRQEAQIDAALAAIGIDWSSGPPHPRGGDLPLAVSLDLGPDGVIVAGQEEVIRVKATNLSDHPLYRVTLLAAEQEPLAQAEFWFGRILPGETKEWATKVALLPGYPTERTALALTAYDSGEDPLGDLHVRMPVQGAPLSQLAWKSHWSDAAPGGNGDGVAAPGERISLVIDVENVGAGPVSLPFFRLRSENRTALDLIGGEGSPGPMVDKATGKACVVAKAGFDNGLLVGDASDEPMRVLRHKEALYAPSCVRVLDPEGKAQVVLEMDLKAPPSFADGWHLELLTGDRAGYDWASYTRADVEEAFVQSEDLVLPVGAPWTDPGERRPPRIQVTRAPDPAGDATRVTVSGAVTDDQGVQQVMVFAGEDKVFFAGAGQRDLRSVPFTAEIQLHPGVNTIAVVAKDNDGATATRSVVTYLVTPELTAVAGNLHLTDP